MSRTFQIIRVYRDLSVAENMHLSIQWGSLGVPGLFARTDAATRRRSDELLDLLLLSRLRHERAGNLSGGQRRLLEIGMSLMSEPRLVLLDEATSGVNPTLVADIADRIRAVNSEQQVAFLLVEHNVQFVADLCERVVVLDQGRGAGRGHPCGGHAGSGRDRGLLRRSRRREGGRPVTALPESSAVTAGTPLLQVQDVRAGYFAGQDILTGVDLEVHEGEIVCVIGPNGAGKSTVFKAVYGLVPVRSGRVLCDGRDITNVTPQDALRLAGISIVPQLRSVFAQMTVHENLEMGMVTERDKQRVRERIDYVYDLFPRLGERSKQQAGTMSGGEQRMLEIGRALMYEPRLVLMDEPSAGLAPKITRQIFETIRRLNQQIGLTVLMIEQNARQGLEASHRGYVIEMGRISHHGEAQDLLADLEVRRAFLGAR